MASLMFMWLMKKKVEKEQKKRIKRLQFKEVYVYVKAQPMTSGGKAVVKVSKPTHYTSEIRRVCSLLLHKN